MEISLRPIQHTDEPVLLAIYGETREAELAQTDWTDEQKRAFVEMQFRAQDTYYKANYAEASFDLILADGDIAGRLYLARWPDELRIIDIALLAPFQRRGIGTRLLQEIQAEAAGAGKAVRIHVERFNPALNLYARLGFRLVEDKGTYLFLEWSPEVQHTGPADQENTAS
jgi:ribosomal protein S18 acetylase RimI-like enzyme